MSDWITIDETHVIDAMTVALAASFGTWIHTNPEKAARFALLISEVVSEFRSALAANRANIMDPDPQKLPLSCARHAETLIISRLRIEMGQVLYEVDVQLMTRAEIFVKQIIVSRLPLEMGDDAGRGIPTYTIPEERLEEETQRAL